MGGRGSARRGWLGGALRLERCLRASKRRRRRRRLGARLARLAPGTRGLALRGRIRAPRPRVPSADPRLSRPRHRPLSLSLSLLSNLSNLSNLSLAEFGARGSSRETARLTRAGTRWRAERDARRSARRATSRLAQANRSPTAPAAESLTTPKSGAGGWRERHASETSRGLGEFHTKSPALSP